MCLKIDDPIASLHKGKEDYFLARLPGGDSAAADEPARATVRRSFAAYRKRQEGEEAWIDSRLDAALQRREELAPKQDLAWLERVAASAGLPYEIVVGLTELVDASAFTGASTDCMNVLFDWIEAHPTWLMHLIRPNDIEGLFGKDIARSIAMPQSGVTRCVAKAAPHAWAGHATMAAPSRPALAQLAVCNSASRIFRRVCTCL